jgi:hypothetical protein
MVTTLAGDRQALATLIGEGVRASTGARLAAFAGVRRMKGHSAQNPHWKVNECYGDISTTTDWIHFST